jgi:hypothetical protein
MTKTEHTEGPWNVDPTSGEDIIWGADGSIVAQALNANFPANAPLIAAAPSLKDGCNALIGLIQLVCGRDDMPAEIREALQTSHRLEEAVAAVAKAAV